MTVSEKLAKLYPRDLALDDGRHVVLRPMASDDEGALRAFFQKIPVEERRLFKDDVTNPRILEKWCRKIDYERILPILALDGSRIAADATLHRNLVHASSHVGSVKVSVDPEYRGVGLARTMIAELLDLAPSLGVAIVQAEVLPVQKRALALFEELNFVTVATLPQHVRDLTDRFHDLIIMTHAVIPPEQLSPDAHVDLENVDIGGPG